jgi:trimeric autotransporter adhesin
MAMRELSRQAGSTQAGAASTTMSWSISGGNKPWSMGAITLVPAAALPAFVNLKTIAITSDPVNGTSNPKYIPGAVALYTIQITNTGSASPDSNSVFVFDAVPAHTTLYVGDLTGANSGPVQFVDGSTTSGLSYTYAGLASITDNVDFSNNGGASYTYTPAPDANGYDANVTNIRINPQGTFAASGGSPSFQVNFRVKVN